MVKTASFFSQLLQQVPRDEFARPFTWGNQGEAFDVTND
jgi:hypothetical protein